MKRKTTLRLQFFLKPLLCVQYFIAKQYNVARERVQRRKENIKKYIFANINSPNIPSAVAL
jgi:hypothetical protein